MSRIPQPLFDTFECFHELNFLKLSNERPAVHQYLKSFEDGCRAVDSYLVVRGFLKSYAGNQSTFNSFRTHVERLLLWALIVARKPLLDLRRSDAEQFMEFCLNPPADWVGPMVKSRFKRIGGRKRLKSDEYVVNPDWMPFSCTVSKRERKMAAETMSSLSSRTYHMAQGSVAQVFAVCGSFFQHAMDEGLTEANPFRAIKQKSIYKQRNTMDVASRSLTELQWSFVIDTAEQMADDDPAQERTLFVVATLFAMYLRVSDLVGRANWRPTMGDFRRDTTGNWWFHVVGKGNKAAKIVSVRPTHLPNSSIKDDGVRVFLSGRDSPYRRDFHAPTKLLPQTVQGPGCSGVPATRCDRFQRCHPPRHQCQRHSQVATALSRSTASGVAGVRSCESYAKTTS